VNTAATSCDKKENPDHVFTNKNDMENIQRTDQRNVLLLKIQFPNETKRNRGARPNMQTFTTNDNCEREIYALQSNQ
jgi:hypothetical protein